jgi:hypothetical protein
MPQILVLEDEELSELLEIVNTSGSSNHPALLAFFGATAQPGCISILFLRGSTYHFNFLTGVPAVFEHLLGIQMLLASSVSCPSHFIGW